MEGLLSGVPAEKFQGRPGHCLRENLPGRVETIPSAKRTKIQCLVLTWGPIAGAKNQITVKLQVKTMQGTCMHRCGSKGHRHFGYLAGHKLRLVLPQGLHSQGGQNSQNWEVRQGHFDCDSVRCVSFPGDREEARQEDIGATQ